MSKKNLGLISIVIACLALNTLSLLAQEKNSTQQIIDRLNEQSKVFVVVAEKVTPAVVNISVTRKISTKKLSPFNDSFGNDFFRRFFKDRMPQQRQRPYMQKGLGSGVIVSADGYILSNNHVVSKADKVTVKLADRREFEAKVVGTDEKTDVAVLKINAKNLPVADIGDSNAIAVGQWVLAIGNPFGLSQTVTAGIISAKGRSYVGIAEYEDFIQTDAAINPGNSGGPLVSLKGQIIGINTAIVSRSGGYQGIGFAIPINMARHVMDQIISKGKVSRGWLGVSIQDVNQDLAKSFNLKNVEGVLIADIVKDSPAEKSGLKQGDVLLRYNDLPISNMNQLRNLVASTAPGTNVTIAIQRQDRKMEIAVAIGDLGKIGKKLVDTKHVEELTKGVEELKGLGLTLQEITPELAEKYSYDGQKGVIITKIEPGSLAEQYRLSPGNIILQINRKTINSLADVKKALALDSRRILLLIRSGNMHRYLAVPRR